MKKIIYAIVALVILGAAYYFISPLFKESEIREELPDFARDAMLQIKQSKASAEPEEPASSNTTFESVEITEEPVVIEQEQEEEASEEVAQEQPPQQEEVVSTPEPEPEPVVEETQTSEPTVEGPFPVVGTPGHAAGGDAYVLRGNGQTVVRYEDFSTVNGPRLHVYLAKDLGARDFIDLGPIKATSGDINYEIPEGVDLSEYRYILTWCVPFRVLFNSADLQ